MGCCEAIGIAVLTQTAKNIVDKITACCCPCSTEQNAPNPGPINENKVEKLKNTGTVNFVNNYYGGNSGPTENSAREQNHGRAAAKGQNRGAAAAEGQNTGPSSSSTGHDPVNGAIPAVQRNHGAESVEHKPVEGKLKIEHSEKQECWEAIDDPRFPEALELKSVWWLHIEATTNFNELPAPKTQYGVYLIFKITNSWKGLDTELLASVNDGVQQKTSFVCLMEIEQQGGHGEWREVKLGEFFCDYNTRDRQVKVTLVDPDNADQTKVKQKVGLIVGGIEFRPAI